ncbi:MAG: hypothetical protein WC303_01145 [Candidatus Paceibacterota bacterium]|jgi:hypothetical protein
MEITEKIKTALKNANNIGLFTGDNPDKDAIGSTLAIFFALKDIGKNVFLVNPASIQKINNVLPKTNQNRVMFSFLGEASEIFYEKLANRTNVYLTPSSGLIEPNSFFCETTTEKRDAIQNETKSFDLLLTLGIHDYKIIEKNFAENPDALFECNIINIDNNIGNQNYGDINFIEDYPCLSQTVACFISRLDKIYQSKKSLSFLLFGLYNSPQNNRTKKNFITFKWLIDNNGNFDFINVDEKKPNPELKIMEETIRNLDKSFLKQFDIGVSFLKEDIFNLTGATSQDLTFTFEKMKNFFHLSSFVLLWKDSKNSVKGIFYSNTKELAELIKSQYKGSFKENRGIIILNEPDLLKAKADIVSHFIKKTF